MLHLFAFVCFTYLIVDIIEVPPDIINGELPFIDLFIHSLDFCRTINICQVCGRAKTVIKRDGVLALIVSTEARKKPNHHRIKCKITTMVSSIKDINW